MLPLSAREAKRLATATPERTFVAGKPVEVSRPRIIQDTGRRVNAKGRLASFPYLSLAIAFALATATAAGSSFATRRSVSRAIHA